MQSPESQSRSADAMSHPSSEEWMAYLYDEVLPEHKEQLCRHLANCARCGRQLNQWRASLKSLDTWELAPLRRKPVAWPPATLLRWAVAAALVLGVGFMAGRTTSQSAREVAELQAAVTQLTERVQNAPAVLSNNPVRDELIQLLANYSRLNEERRGEDRRATAVALRELETRLGKLRAELETVALNTESGFRQTKQGLVTLAAYTLFDAGSVEPKHFDSQN